MKFTKKISNKLIWALLILMTIQVVFFIQPYRVCVISGMSMSSTLLPKDMVIVKKVSPNILFCDNRKFEFGDLVVVKNPEKPNVDHNMILKRIIGLPGDTVTIYRDLAIISHQLQQLVFPETSGLLNSTPPSFDSRISEVAILAEELFLCGDNWYHSLDSRIFGTIPYSIVFGKVVLSFRNFKKIVS